MDMLVFFTSIATGSLATLLFFDNESFKHRAKIHALEEKVSKLALNQTEENQTVVGKSIVSSASNEEDDALQRLYNSLAEARSMDAPLTEKTDRSHPSTTALSYNSKKNEKEFALSESQSLIVTHTDNLNQCMDYCKEIETMIHILNERNTQRYQNASNKLHRHRLLNPTSNRVCEKDVSDLIDIRIELLHIYTVVEAYRLRNILRTKEWFLSNSTTPSAPVAHTEIRTRIFQRLPSLDSIVANTSSHHEQKHNVFPDEFLVNEKAIADLFLKIGNKKELLGSIEEHRFATLQSDYQKLCDAYFGYEEGQRHDLHQFLTEGLEDIQSKLEEIYAYTLEGGQYRMRHRVTVIKSR